MIDLTDKSILEELADACDITQDDYSYRISQAHNCLDDDEDVEAWRKAADRFTFLYNELQKLIRSMP